MNLKVLDLSQQILAYVREYDHVSFVEFQKWFPTYKSKGCTWYFCADRNIVLWEGMNKEFYQALQNLLDTETISMNACSPLMVYMADGGLLRMKVFNGKIPRIGSKTPTWIPVTFSTSPTEHVLRGKGC